MTELFDLVMPDATESLFFFVFVLFEVRAKDFDLAFPLRLQFLNPRNYITTFQTPFYAFQLISEATELREESFLVIKNCNLTQLIS